MKLEISGQIFEKKKYTDVEFRENPSSGSRNVASGQMDTPTDRQTDTTRLIVAFPGFSNMPKN